jgi:predicted MFS family arabinose efflux permease
VLSFNVAAISALVPSVASEFNIDPFAAGKMLWFYLIPYGAAALLYGPLTRSRDPRSLLLFCMCFLSVSNLLGGLAETMNQLFFSRVLSGISGAGIIPVALIMIAKTTPESERGKRVGFFFSSTFVASLAGVFLSGVIGWRWIFLIPAAAGIVSFLTLYVFLPPHLLKKEDFTMQYRQALEDKTVFRLFAYIFLVSLFYHSIQQWLGVYFSLVNHLDQFFISLLLTTVGVSSIIGSAAGGVFSDRLGRTKVIRIGNGILIVVASSLAVKGSLGILFVLMFAWGLGWTFNHVGVSTFLTDLPLTQVFESASLNSSVRFLSAGLGGVLGEIVMQKSFNLGFILFGSCLLILFMMTKKLIVLRQEV